MMSNRDDTNFALLYSVHQRIRKIVEYQHSCAVCRLPTHLWIVAQQNKHPVERIGEIFRGCERTFPYIPIDGSICISARFVTEAYSHQLWQQLFWRGAWS